MSTSTKGTLMKNVKVEVSPWLVYAAILALQFFAAYLDSFIRPWLYN